MKKLITAAFAAAVLASCATGVKTGNGGNINGEWKVVSIDNKKINTDSGLDAPFLGFRGSDLYGSTSCNRLTGAVRIDEKKGTIDFSSTGSTRMMCHDMQTETQMLNALGRATTFKVNGNTLNLCNKDGKTVMELQKK